MDACDGSLELLEHALNRANAEVAPDAEERKGGAGDLGKALLSAGKDQLAVICHVPKARHEVLKPKEWVEAILGKFEPEIVEEAEEVVKAIVKADKEKERFPLKIRDEAINLGYSMLLEKGLVGADDSDDDGIDGEALENAGIEW